MIEFGLLSEVELVEEDEVEDLWGQYDRDDLYWLLKKYHIIWVSRDVLLCRRACRSCCEVALGFRELCTLGYDWTDDESSPDSIQVTVCTSRREGEESSEELECIFQLLARGVGAVQRVHIDLASVRAPLAAPSECPISSVMLERLLELNGNQEETVFSGLSFSEAHCRVLASFCSSFGGTLRFRGCSLFNNGRFFLDAIGQYEGPEELEFVKTKVDDLALQRALQTTSSLKSLELKCAGVNIPRVFKAAGQSQSLAKLHLHCWEDEEEVTENDFVEMFQSLSKNKVLEDVALEFDFAGLDEEHSDEVEVELLSRLSRVIANMLEVNSTLCKLNVDVHYPVEDMTLEDTQIWRKEIQPRLDANGFRKRLKALSESDEVEPSHMLNFLLSNEEVRDSPRLLWIVLSQPQYQQVVADHVSASHRLVVLKRKRKRYVELVAKIDQEVEAIERLGTDK